MICVKLAPYLFMVKEWKRKETKVAKEYSFTGAVGRSSCGRSGYKEIEFGFKMDSLVFTYLITIPILSSNLPKFDLRRNFRIVSVV